MNINKVVVIGLLIPTIISANGVALAMGQRHKSLSVQVQQGVYSCPMHPDQISDKPGACSICGMALVKKDTKSVNQKPTCSCCGMKK
ncbi:MAG: hypothetical protein HQL15_01365 [Candidatus Omnitrophica bacterium]|nr:hypothetical protein [Candidatus Omnitrophota bacterium]